MNYVKRLIEINEEILRNTSDNEKLVEERMDIVTKVDPKDLVSYMVLNGNKDNHGKLKYELYKIKQICGCIPTNILIKAEDLALGDKRFSHVERISGEITATYRKNNIKTTADRVALIRNINALTKSVKKLQNVEL